MGIVQFGEYRLDARSRELRKHGVRVRLQEKPFQVLIALLENPGEVVTREDLKRRLWPADTVVDFESGLNTAAKRLRTALRDSADAPRYIETVARAGYRFIAPVQEAAAAEPAARGFSRAAILALALTAIAAIAVAMAVSLRRPPEVRFQQITFNRGQVSTARFAPDGHSVIYAAQWEDSPRTLFLTNTLGPESRSLGFAGSSLVSVSRTGELALSQADGVAPISGSSLFRVPMNGGAPVVVDRNVMSADWSPDGNSLALVRAVDGVNQLEYPPGRILYKTAGWLGSVRISPKDDSIAFFEYPLRHDDSGRLAQVDRSGNHRFLSESWESASGIAWHPDAHEVWFTASSNSGARSLYAAASDGRIRTVASVPTGMSLRDISPTGRVLVSRDNRRLEMAARLPGETAERDISWLDWSRAVDISDDGSLILFDESGTAAGGRYLSYVYRTADRNVMRIEEGLAQALSPDAKSVLLLHSERRTGLRLVPLNGGPAEELPPSGLEYQWARFFPGGDALLAQAAEPGGRLRLYQISLHGDSKPVALSPPSVVRNAAISPDGESVAALNSSGALAIYSSHADGPPSRVIPAAEPLAPILWAAPDLLYVQRQRTFSELPAAVFQLNPRTGALRPWKTLVPRDKVGINAVTRILIARDQQSYVYSSRRVLSELLAVDGWR